MAFVKRAEGWAVGMALRNTPHERRNGDAENLCGDWFTRKREEFAIVTHIGANVFGEGPTAWGDAGTGPDAQYLWHGRIFTTCSARRISLLFGSRDSWPYTMQNGATRKKGLTPPPQKTLILGGGDRFDVESPR